MEQPKNVEEKELGRASLSPLTSIRNNCSYRSSIHTSCYKTRVWTDFKVRVRTE